jgi:hypothetical protein
MEIELSERKSQLTAGAEVESALSIIQISFEDSTPSALTYNRESGVRVL